MRIASFLCAPLTLALLAGCDATDLKNVHTISTSGDTFVSAQAPTQNFSTAKSLGVQMDSVKGVQKIALMNFKPADVGVAAANFKGALLSVFATSTDGTTIPALQLYTTASFSDSTVTWNKRPALNQLIYTSKAATSGSWISFNVTAAVRSALVSSGTVGFAIVPSVAGSKILVASNEAATNHPALSVVASGTTTTTTAPATTTTTTPPSTTTSTTSTTTAPTTTTTAPKYPLKADEFGLTPGSGTLMQTDTLPAKLDDFKALGVRWIRSTIPWSNIEPYDPAALPAGKPKYNWKGVDAFTSIFNSPKYVGQFNLIVTFENPPDWATNPKGGIGSVSCAEQPPFDLQQYADAAGALAAHLANQNIHVFELENSPNITPGVWQHANPCAYAQLLKRAYTAIHAPGMPASTTVLTAGIGGVKDTMDPQKPSLFAHMAADEFLSDLYKDGAKGSFDGVSYHPYSSPDYPCDPQAPTCVYDPNTQIKDPYGTHNGWDRMLNARQIMVNNGDGAKLIWMTEFGSATQQGGDGTPVTEQQQADIMVNAFQRASQESWTGPLCIYTYQDGNREDHGGFYMGLKHVDGSPKPSYYAYQKLTAPFRG